MAYKKHPDADKRVASALLAAKELLKLDLYPQHKRELLKICIWKITEADGKYKTRYWSRKAVGLDSSNLNHEHVYRMDDLVEAMIKSPSEAETILARAMACTVTREEHALLTQMDRERPELNGWKRYKELNMEVVDTATGAKADIDVLINQGILT